MINVTEREQKKVKGLIGSRKAASLYNGQSAAKLPKREEGSTNRWRGSLAISTFHRCTFIMDVVPRTEVTMMKSSTGVVYQIKNLKNGKIQSSINGYNQVVVSGNERLTEHEIWKIRDYLISTNLKFTEIASYYNISSALVSDINLGRAWFDGSLEYPLRRQTVKRKQLSQEDIYEIYDLLRDQSLTFKQIAEKFGWSSESVLRKINNGTYSINPLSKVSYPIRKVDSRKGQRNKDRGMF